MVAVPALAPALAASSPTSRLLLLLAPGASRLKLPLAVTGAPLPAMLAFSAACWLPLAWLSTPTVLPSVPPTRTAPRSTLTTPRLATPLATGRAWSMTLATVLICPCTPKFCEPTASSPSPLLTPPTAPALK